MTSFKFVDICWNKEKDVQATVWRRLQTARGREVVYLINYLQPMAL